MRYRTDLDNTYAVATFITATENPSLKLKIMKYYQRIYYCAAVEDEGRRELAYFERELISPV